MNGTENWPLLMLDSLRRKSIFVTPCKFRTENTSNLSAQNVQLIGFLQVMRATCQRRCVKNNDPYKPSNTNVFEANYFLFIVRQKKQMLRTHISHIIFRLVSFIYSKFKPAVTTTIHHDHLPTNCVQYTHLVVQYL